MPTKGSFATEVRRVETAELEGASSDHTPYEYQLGAVIDGTFVPFVTKAGGYIDALHTNAKASAAANGNGNGDGDGDDQ